jgi:transcription elongation factor/antiterminator RfaH
MQADAEPGLASWYAIHTQPKQESRAQGNLAAWGIETYYPKVRERRQNEFTGRCIVTEKPLFSRYIFARFSAHRSMHKVGFTRGVANIVGSRNGPEPVDEEIIQILKSRQDTDGFIQMGEDLKSGDRVVIREGPLRGFDGIFERDLLDSQRVLILLTTISYEGRVVVNKESVRRVA